MENGYMAVFLLSKWQRCLCNDSCDALF